MRLLDVVNNNSTINSKETLVIDANKVTNENKANIYTKDGYIRAKDTN